ncbi:hypothetical protein WJX74_003375 [Apatococcus lobatus]|uniref:Uncharacterized protein n=1 Tax=Apatococcus lobatus TaxID=904363 RepID=A0AAW1RGR4_9CHLO
MAVLRTGVTKRNPYPREFPRKVDFLTPCLTKRQALAKAYGVKVEFANREAPLKFLAPNALLEGPYRGVNHHSEILMEFPHTVPAEQMQPRPPRLHSNQVKDLGPVPDGASHAWVEQAKAQVLQQLEERAQKQSAAAAQPPPAAQQTSTPQDSTWQTTFRQGGFFNKLCSNPSKRSTESGHRLG